MKPTEIFPMIIAALCGLGGFFGLVFHNLTLGVGGLAAFLLWTAIWRMEANMPEKEEPTNAS